MTICPGPVIQSFFADHLRVQKGLRPTSVRSYRDTLRLFLSFVAQQRHCAVTRLSLQDLSFDHALAFLRHLEEVRHNHIRTRNQRLAALRTFFNYVGSRVPDMLDNCERVAAIPTKRTPPPETHFLEREEVSALLKGLPHRGRHCLRDRALLLFLYNTGARVQELADLKVANLDLSAQPRVQLHGKGDKWRWCPLWAETVTQLKAMLGAPSQAQQPESPVFCSRPGIPLTRFGIYKIVRRLASHLDKAGTNPRRVSPHLFRHTAAVHLLESGVEVNVIRAWLGHVSLETTNRYAEITLRTKEAALRTCEAALGFSAEARRRPVWKDDKCLLAWLNSL